MSAALQVLLRDWGAYHEGLGASDYIKLWLFLEKLGCVSEPPEILRKRREENVDNKNVTQ